MFIKCISDNNRDMFYLPDFNKLDDIKEYADKNMPIKCFKVKWSRKRTIFIKEDYTSVYLYLSNYLHYYKINGYLMLEKQYEKIHNGLCEQCKNYSFSYGCLDIYKKEENTDNCLNYDKRIKNTFRDWIRSKIGL